MHSKALKQVKIGLFVLTVVIVTGIVGYAVLENYNMLDSVYMTVITISTTGFKEVRDLSPAGRMLTIFLIIAGMGSIAYTGGRAVQILLEAQLFRRRRMSRKLEALHDHYIICGYGRMGRYICEGLTENKVPFVVIENDPKKIDMLIEKDFVFVNGDATSDDILLTAGIRKAKGLAAVLKTDAENVFAILSAKELNPGIYLISRAVEEVTETKLLKAGADRVVLPYELSGNRFVHLMLKPGVTDFIENVAKNRDLDISLEEIPVKENSSLVGKSLADSPIRKELNIIIVGIKRADGKFIYNPKSTHVIQNGDQLLAIGELPDLNKLTDQCLAQQV